MESRPIWLQEGIFECGEPRCAERPVRASECLGGRRTALLAWVGPWQYQCSLRTGYWVGGRGSTHPVYPSQQYPVCTLPVHPPRRTTPVPPSAYKAQLF